MPLTEEELEGLEPRELLQLGVDLFNDGRHFDSHEAWEAAWIPSEPPLRFFYQGLIQVAAAFVHLTRNEYPGTEKLLKEALNKLARFRRDCLGIEVDELILEAGSVLKRVVDLGPKRLGEIPKESLPRIHLMPAPETRTAAIAGEDQLWLQWEWFDPKVPAIVLLHPPGLVPHVWQPVASRLTPAYRVFAPELPGHGVTPSRGNAESDVRALESWLRSTVPDALVVVEAGSGGIATRLAATVGATPVAMRDLTTLDIDPAADPRLMLDIWPGRWDLHRALQNRTPFSSWRPDVLWTYVESATELLPREDAPEGNASRGMTEEPPARLRWNRDAVSRFANLAARDVAERTIAISPLGQPELAAEGLMKLLGRMH